jgi:YD repeat-containing protein
MGGRRAAWWLWCVLAVAGCGREPDGRATATDGGEAPPTDAAATDAPDFGPDRPAPDASPPPVATAIRFPSATIEVEVGLREPVFPRVIDDGGHAVEATLEWTSSDPAVVAVGDGVPGTSYGRYLEARALGQAQVTVRSGEVEAQLAVTVVPERPVELRVTPKPLVLGEGDEATLEATAFLRDQTPVPVPVAVEWRSEDPDVVTVDADGRVRGLRQGTATIVARAGELRGQGRVQVLRAGLANEVPYPGPCSASGILENGQFGVRRYTYDDEGRPVVDELRLDDRPTRRTTTTYDEEGHRVRTEADDGIDGDADRIETWTYVDGRLVESAVHDAEGDEVTTYTYDADGRLAEERTPMDGADEVVLHAYDAQGRETRTEARWPADDPSRTEVLELAYQGDRLASIVQHYHDEMGGGREARYEYRYDAEGRESGVLLFQLYPDGQRVLRFRQENIRDRGGNLVYEEHHFIFDTPEPENTIRYTFECWQE